MKNFNLEDYLIESKLIKASIYYAMYSRLNDDQFCNLFDLRINCKTQNNINNLVEYIQNIYSLSKPYIQDESFAYAFPKGNFFIRRCIYLPFKEFAVRYHLINTLSLAVENSFIQTSFSNRTQRSKTGFIYLFQDYYPNYKKFIKWAEKSNLQNHKENKMCCVLTADITSFYDSISHDYLIESIFSLTGNILPRKYETLLHQILKPEVEFYSVVDGFLKLEKKQQGLLTGHSTEGYLANILLTRLDELMINHGFNYARYVDDIRVITDSKEKAIQAVNIIQEELHRIGLNLNSAKTDIICDPQSIDDLFRKNHEISLFDQLSTEKTLEEYDSIDIENIAFKKILNEEDCTKITNYLFDLSNFDEYDDELIIQLISKIPYIIYEYPKTIKKNTWNIVKLIGFGFSNSIMIAAYKAMNEIFKDTNIMDYARTRLIHHLIKPRKKDPPYILMIVKNNEQLRQKLITIFQDFLSRKSIDLNLNSLYALWILSHKDNGNTFDELLFRKNIENYLPRPISHNLSRVLSSIFSHKESLNFFDDFDFTDLSDNSERSGLDDFNY